MPRIEILVPNISNLLEKQNQAEIAEKSKEQAKPLISGIVAHADLTLGASVEQVIEAHEEAGRGLFRGVRHALAHSKHPEHMTIVGRSPAGLYENENFREGVRTLGRLGSHMRVGITTIRIKNFWK